MYALCQLLLSSDQLQFAGIRIGSGGRGWLGTLAEVIPRMHFVFLSLSF